MTELHETIVAAAPELPVTPTPEPAPESVLPPDDSQAVEQPIQGPEVSDTAATPAPVNGDGAATSRWHAEAGRKGAQRLQQLIQEGKLYEQEHGLKRGRQRRRQLIELGKLYEQEHGLRPEADGKTARRLSRLDRDDLLATFLRCLVRIARPSFRPQLLRLIEALQQDGKGSAV